MASEKLRRKQAKFKAKPPGSLLVAPRPRDGDRRRRKGPDVKQIIAHKHAMHSYWDLPLPEPASPEDQGT